MPKGSKSFVDMNDHTRQLEMLCGKKYYGPVALVTSQGKMHCKVCKKCANYELSQAVTMESYLLDSTNEKAKKITGRHAQRQVTNTRIKLERRPQEHTAPSDDDESKNMVSYRGYMMYLDPTSGCYDFSKSYVEDDPARRPLADPSKPHILHKEISLDKGIEIMHNCQ